MRAALATAPGGDKPNEDWAAVTDRLAIALDGLTAPADLGTGCVHGVPWYVRHLGSALVNRLTDEDITLKDALAAAIGDTAAAHAGRCELSHAGTPSATVAILRTGTERVDWLVLSDAVIVLDTANGIEVHQDERVTTAVSDERRAALEAPFRTPEKARLVSVMVEAQRRVRNRPEGYWVAAADASVADHACAGSLPLGDVRRAAVLTDGAARLAEFGEVTWAGLLDLLAEVGPDGVIARVRAVEGADPEGRRWPRFKGSDDAAAIYIEP